MSEINIELRISARMFRGGEKFFGPGMAELLEKVDRLGSLRGAALEMNMAYSKAWTMLRRAEEVLDYPLLVREVGGVRGGSSCLTPQGRLLLERYRRLQLRIRQAGDSFLEEIFSSDEAEKES